MPVGARVMLMVLAWLPLVAMYYAMSIPVPLEGMIAELVGTMALLAVAVAVNVAVVSAWMRDARADDGTPPVVRLDEPVAFAFSQQSRGSALVLFGGGVLVMLVSSAVHGHGRVDLAFVAGVGLLLAATSALIMWKGRYYVDVFDDRIRVQQAFWRSREELESREGLPIDGVTRVALERGWGNWGFAPVIAVFADVCGEVDAACIPLGQSDRREGLSCLNRVLEDVDPDAVEPSVLHLVSAFEALEAASCRSGEAALADRALRLASGDKLEEAAVVLDSAASADLRRAGAELAEVVRATASPQTSGEV
jgi:hypothetical protein